MDSGLLARLAEHQRTIDAIADQGTRLLEGQEAPDPMELSRLRWSLVRAMTEYRQFKHREIFDPAIARGGEPLVRMSTALKDDCTALGDAFTAYVQEWSAKGTSGHWPEYRDAALAMYARIRRHLAREQRNVASLFRASRVSAAPVWPVRSG